MKSFVNHKSLSVIRSVLVNHQKDLYVNEMACNVVIALTLNRKVIIDEEVDADLTSAILIALENHIDSAKLVNSCCMALSLMINLLGIYFSFKTTLFIYNKYVSNIIMI